MNLELKEGPGTRENAKEKKVPPDERQSGRTSHLSCKMNGLMGPAS